MKAINKIVSAAVLVLAAGALTVTISASIDAAQQHGTDSGAAVTTLAGGSEWGV